MAGIVISVNTAPVREADYAIVGRSAIAKRPVTGPVYAGVTGLAGDEVGDPVHHGGSDQAVYAFAREDLDRWQQELGRPIPDGMFGENLTTRGVDVNAAVMGERWRIGTAVFELCAVRIPCRTFAGRMRTAGYDATGWVRRFTADARPGPYLRVLTEGEVRAGDTIEVVHRPRHGLTVSDVFSALTLDRTRLPELLRIDALAAGPRATAATYVGG